MQFSDIARRQHAQLLAKNTGTAAVVCHRHDSLRFGVKYFSPRSMVDSPVPPPMQVIAGACLPASYFDSIPRPRFLLLFRTLYDRGVMSFQVPVGAIHRIALIGEVIRERLGDRHRPVAAAVQPMQTTRFLLPSST